jgi:hypothetical protein
MLVKSLAETLIILVCKEVVKIMISQEAAKETEKIPASADTISRDIFSDIESTLIEKLRLSGVFALQADESTNISGYALLISNVRYTDGCEILFCLPLPGYTTEEIFKVTDQYFSDHNLKWHNCISICTGGAEWVVKLAFPANIFAHLNELNRKMPGRNSNILTSSDKIESFRAKLVLWISHAVNGSEKNQKKCPGFDSKTLGAISRKNELLFS